jgi:hypothetical protein
MISVTGAVSIEGDGATYLVSGDGSEVTIDVRTQRRISVSSLARVPGAIRTLRALSEFLVREKHDVRIVRDGKTLATVGGSRPSGFFGKLLRIERFRLGK